MVGDVATAVYVDTVAVDRGAVPRRLAEAGFAVREDVATTADEVVCAAGDDAVCLLVGDSPVPASVFAHAPQVRLVATVTVGVDHIDLDAARAAGVWVANCPDAVTEEVAVTALAHALGLVRHISFLDRQVRAGGWDAFASGARHRVSTLTLGIVGLGRTGRALARLAEPVFGRVIGSDPAAPTADVPLVPLDELLAASDVVCLHAPHVRGSGPLLDARAIGQMRTGAYLVNVARGGLIDSDALVAALDDGRLAGAALDVLDHEPPAVDHPLRAHPRVVVTPHAAFWSVEAEAETLDRQADNAIAWRRTGRPLTPVFEVAAG